MFIGVSYEPLPSPLRLPSPLPPPTPDTQTECAASAVDSVVLDTAAAFEKEERKEKGGGGGGAGMEEAKMTVTDISAKQTGRHSEKSATVLQCVAVCCSLLQCVAACCSVLQRVVACCSVLHRAAASYSAWKGGSLLKWLCEMNMEPAFKDVDHVV